MTYRVPRYTEISHFRAPYKDSLMPMHSPYQDSMLGFGRVADSSSASKMQGAMTYADSSSGREAEKTPSAPGKSGGSMFGPISPMALPKTQPSKKGPPSPGPKAISVAKGKSQALRWVDALAEMSKAVLLGPDSRLRAGMDQPTFSELVSVMAALAMDPASNWRDAIRKEMRSIAAPESDPSKREKILNAFAKDLSSAFNGVTGYAFAFKVSGTALDPNVSAQGAEKWVSKNYDLARRLLAGSMDPPFAMAAAVVGPGGPAPAPSAPSYGYGTEGKKSAPAPSAPGSGSPAVSMAMNQVKLFGMRGLGQSPTDRTMAQLAPRAPGQPRPISLISGETKMAAPAPKAPGQGSYKVKSPSSADPVVARAKRMPELFKSAEQAFVDSVVCLPQAVFAIGNLKATMLSMIEGKFASPSMAKKYAASENCVGTLAAIGLLKNQLKFIPDFGPQSSTLKKDINFFLSKLVPVNVVRTPVFSLTTQISVEDGLLADAKVIAKQFTVSRKLSPRPIGVPLTSTEQKVVEQKAVEESKKEVSKASDSLAKAQQENEDLKKLIEDLKSQISVSAPTAASAPMPPVVYDQMMMAEGVPPAAVPPAAVPPAAEAPAEEISKVVQVEEEQKEKEESAAAKYGPYVAGAALLGVFGYMVYKNRKG